MNRRRLLTTLGAGGAAIAVTGLLDACTSGGSDGADPTASTTPNAVSTPDPRTAAAAVERTLHDEAVAVLAAHPDLAATVAPVRDAHAAHLLALVGEQPATGPATSSPDASIGTSSPSPTATGTASAALLGLAARERSAARLHAASAERPNVEGADARLVASLSAYSAAQDLVLTQAAR